MASMGEKKAGRGPHNYNSIQLGPPTTLIRRWKSPCDVGTKAAVPVRQGKFQQDVR